MPNRLIQIALLLVGGSPIAIGVFVAGIMLGRPAPCSDPPVCTPRVHGAEVLLLPIGPGVAFLAGAGLVWFGRKSNEQVIKNRREPVTG